MARIDNLENFLTDVANSIRAKKETTTKILASEFDIEIASIETSSEPILQEKSVAPTTDLQKIKPDTGFDGLSKVEVKAVTSAIDNNIQPSNIKKGVSILGITGSLEEGIAPSGTLDITTNGIHNVSQYASANVNIGENTITKGIIVNSCNTSGYATDVSVVGLTTIPNYYFSTYSSTYSNAVNKYLKKVSSSVATKVGDYCFSYCEALTEINIPNLITVGDYAFNYCKKLEITELPDSITSIGSYGLAYCEKIALTKLPDSLTSVGKYTFRGCKGLVNSTIPSKLASLGQYCFAFCSNLQEVYFEGNTSLVDYSLANCNQLTKVVYKNATSVPACKTTSFSFTEIEEGTGFIYVPDALVENFKSASGWSTYANQIKGLSELE